MTVKKATWAAIRAAYEKGLQTVASLATEYTVSVSTIYRHARDEGWTRENINSRGSRKLTGREEGRKPRSKKGGGQSAMIVRLYSAIDSKLTQFEARLCSGASVSSADSERETRELSSMIRSFEKVTTVAGDIDKRRGKPARTRDVGDGKDSVERSADAERLRNEIAERLERLHRNGLLERRSSDPGSG